VKSQYDAEVDQLRSIAEFLNGNEEEDSFDDEIMSEEEDEIIQSFNTKINIMSKSIKKAG